MRAGALIAAGAAALAVVIGGCTERPTGAASAARSGAPAAAPAVHSDALPPSRPGPTTLRRLTRAQYDRTVRDLFGTTLRPAQSWPPDEELVGFATSAAVSPLSAELYLRAAEAVARDARPRLAAMAGSHAERAEAGDEARARRFVERVGLRAWRRPLVADEMGRLLDVYEGARATGESYDDALARVVEAMLAAPELVYVIERGTPERARDGAWRLRLTSWEMASRLSYLIWGTTPDDAILSLAAEDGLATADGVERAARRMLRDRRAREAVVDFVEQWLGASELRGVSKGVAALDDAPPLLMEAELRALVEDVVFEGDGRLGTLLTVPYTFANEPLARLYGVVGVRGSELRRVTLDPSRRAGVLTTLGMMTVFATATESSPVRRGKLVRERLLCQPIAAPPAGMILAPPDPDPRATTRERFEDHVVSERCERCHVRMDPIGFAFEHYDGIGRWRERENGRPIDAHGTIDGTRDANGPVDGAVELAHRLAGSADVRACAVKQLFFYALGRSDGPPDAAAVAAVTRRFEASRGDLRELFVALVSSDAYRYRLPSAPEVAAHARPTSADDAGPRGEP